MRHEISRSGTAFRLRPVGLEDAEFLVELRTDPELGRHLHATSPSIDDQRNWTENYFAREGDYYFVVEHIATGRPEGAIAIYNIDPETKQAEWGRWILRKGSLAATESAALIYEVGFHDLNLNMMYTHTEAVNERVVSFHSSLGAEYWGPVVGPEGEQWIEQRVLKELWSKLQPEIQKQAALAARLANR